MVNAILTVDFTLEKDVIRTDRSVSFFKSEDMPHPDPLAGSSSNLTNKNLELMKDILMTYNFYNKDLGKIFLVTMFLLLYSQSSLCKR